MTHIPQNFRFFNTLTLMGLSESQGLAYEYLLRHGEQPARVLVKEFKIERTLMYKVLQKLCELGIVVKKEMNGKVTVFEAAHPAVLEQVLSQREQNIHTSKKALQSISADLVSEYNLHAGKPVVQFFEGLEGAFTVVKDGLRAKKEICSYMDSETVLQHAPEINKEFVKRRHDTKLTHRILVRDTENERNIAQQFNSPLTLVRFMNLPQNFPSLLRMYDDTVCYISLNPSGVISVLMRDKHIATMQQLLFESHWKHATL